MMLAAVLGTTVLLASAVTPATTASSPSSAPSASSTAPPVRVAVIIGYNGGAPDPRPALSFADDDAARLYKSLAASTARAYLLTTFDRESARLYPELADLARDPSKESLAAVLGDAYWLLRQKKAEGKETELVFAFAGHGDVTDAGEGFVVLSDGAFTRSDLETQVIGGSPASTNHLIIDACSSYFMVARGGDTAQSESRKLTPDVLDVLKGVGRVDEAARARTGVFVSTSSAVEVHESAELESGVFSFLLRTALAGAADGNGDGNIEYAEAAGFIAASSNTIDDPRARLAVHAEAPLRRPHVALSSLRHSGAKHFLAIDKSGPVHLRVLDAHGAPYAELHVVAGGNQPLLLALVGNPFYLVQEGSAEAVLVPRSAGAYALSALSFEEAERARGSDEKFRGLFTNALDASFMRGFLSTVEMTPPKADAPFTVAYASAGTPASRIPVGMIGLGTLGVAGAFAIAAGVSLTGNVIAFDDMERDFQRTRVIDAEKSIGVERWRTAVGISVVGAAVFGLTGGSLYAWSLSLEDGELEVPR